MTAGEPSYEDSDDVPVIPEPEPDRLPERRVGFASWTGTRDNGPPPYEESIAQVETRMRYRAEADIESVERRRKRKARVAQRADAAERRAEKARIEEKWRAG